MTQALGGVTRFRGNHCFARRTGWDLNVGARGGELAGVVAALAGDRLGQADAAGGVAELIRQDVRQPTSFFLAVNH